MNTLRVAGTRCEYKVNPLGVQTARPRLSWKLESDRRGVLQSAYRVQVAREDDTFAAGRIVWDTGKVASDQSIHIEYKGDPLQLRTRYSYRVMVWDPSGESSPWSEPAFWETGLPEPGDWKAEWITPDAAALDPQSEAAFVLRKPFTVKANVSRATLFATSLGLYELELNGGKVGDSLFTPGWTSYKHRLQVQAYDVTQQLGEGANAIGASLANGWYMGTLAWEGKRNIFGETRALLLQLHIRYADGTEDVVTSDATWRASTGPIRMSELYHGETYDARLELPGWSRAGYDDSAWAPVTVLAHPKHILVGEDSERVRITERLQPVSVLRTPAGETLLDMGQNMVGRIRMTVDAPAGTVVTLQHAEVLDKDGNFYTGNLRKAKQTVTYICKGGASETYAPAFAFQGFRYVKVEGFPEPLEPDRFVGEVIHTDMEPTGTFECSHPLLNQLQRNIVWGQRGNFLDVPTDCPQRDERLGWTGDAQVFIRTAAFNYGVAPFFTKWLKDLKADQKPSGGVPFVIPDVLGENAHSSAAWGDAAVICPWTIYLCYGDTRILEEQYDSMKAWVEYIRSQGDNELLWNTGFHFGDWLGLDAKENSYIGATPRDLIATAFYAYSTSLLAKTAAVLGRGQDEREYRELYRRITAEFEREFMTPSGRLAAHTQTAHALALIFDLTRDVDARKRLAATLAAYVEEQKVHLTTGFVGTPYLCHALSANGYHDLAVKLVQQEDYPSWLYSIHKGATTIWEHWDGIKPDGSFWSDDMNSYNHYAYGSIGDWLYRVVTGIEIEEEAPGYKRILLQPNPDSGFMYAKASLNSPYGTIRSEWRKHEDGSVAYVFEVPANTTARIRLPVAGPEAASVNGGSALQAEGVLHAEVTEGGLLQLKVGSGVYSIVCK